MHWKGITADSVGLGLPPLLLCIQKTFLLVLETKLDHWLWDGKTNSSWGVAKINKVCPFLFEYVQDSCFSSRKYQQSQSGQD